MRTLLINLQLKPQGSRQSSGVSGDERTAPVLCLGPPGLGGRVGLSGEQGAGPHIVGLGGHLSGKWFGPTCSRWEEEALGGGGGGTSQGHRQRGSG